MDIKDFEEGKVKDFSTLGVTSRCELVVCANYITAKNYGWGPNGWLNLAATKDLGWPVLFWWPGVGDVDRIKGRTFFRVTVVDDPSRHLPRSQIDEWNSAMGEIRSRLRMAPMLWIG